VTVSAQFDINVDPGLDAPAKAKRASLTTTERSLYLRSENAVQTGHADVASCLRSLAAEGTPKSVLLGAVFEFCSDELADAPDTGPTDAAESLRTLAATPVGRARAMVALCRAARMPARVVTGFVLDSAGSMRPHVWVEVHRKKRWVPFDPLYGFSSEVPAHHVPVRRGGIAVARASGARRFHESYEAERIRDTTGSAVPREKSAFAVFDLRRLPPGMRQTLTVLLLLPVAALLTSFFRNVVGLQTFGIFTPGLLALSFLYADLWTGAILFTAAMGVGMVGRRMLAGLRLLAVPRLGVVLTLVILTLALAVSTFDFLGWTPSARAVLLPTVILTVMIERFHVSAEEDGLRHAVALLLGTLTVALVCLPVLRARALGEMVLAYPETLLFVGAALTGIGRYTGYRLTELWRFGDLGAEGSLR
jgi:hypothetical protein